MKRVRVDGLTAKIEVVEGTDANPSPATDGIQLDKHIWTSLDVDYLERNQRDEAMGGRMGRSGVAQPAGPYAKLTAVAALKGAGAAYAAGVRPELDVLLRACGLSATLDVTAGSESITYAPIDEGHESATIYAYSAGSLFKLLGCRGKLSISSIPARIGMVTLEILGVLPGVPIDVPMPAITYPRRALQPPVLKAEDLTIDGYAARYKSATFDQNADVQASPRGGAPEGHAGYSIVDYDPQLKMQIDSPTKAAFDPWALERAGTQFPWSLAWGQTQYNKGIISGPNGQLIKVPPSDDNGFAMLDLQMRAFHGAAGEDAFQLIFN